MRFRVAMKTPDALYYAVHDACAVPDSASEEEVDAARDNIEATMEMCEEKWFKYGDGLMVEIDTEAKTCMVVENERS